MRLLKVSFNFVKNLFLLNLHFSDLWNLFHLYREYVLLMFSLLNMKVFWVCYFLLINIYVSVYERLFILSQRLKRYKDHIQAYIAKLWNLFRIKASSFQRKHGLNFTILSFYGSIMFAIKTVFISEKITEYRFGALLQIYTEMVTNLAPRLMFLALKAFDDFKNKQKVYEVMLFNM